MRKWNVLIVLFFVSGFVWAGAKSEFHRLPDGTQYLERNILRQKGRYTIVEKFEIAVPFESGNYSWGSISLSDGILVLSSGYTWDGASGPVLDTKNFLRASLVHDALFDLLKYGGMPRENLPQVNALFIQLAIEDGVSKLRTSIASWGLRVLGETIITRFGVDKTR